MAYGLLQAGARVAFADLVTPCLPASKVSENAIAVTVDVTDSTNLNHVIDAIGDTLGPVDILINNAGIGPGSVRSNFYEDPLRFWELDEPALKRFFDINVIAPTVLSALVLPAMIEKKWGRIINVTTSLGSMTRAGRAGYGPSKAALEAQTSIMAGDLAGSGVTANVLIPGAIADTAMVPTESQIDRSALLGPDRMAAPAVWLASEESRDVSGQRILASEWDCTLPGPNAAARAGARITFGAADQEPIRPPGFIDRSLTP
jgi:3-oxoacyl-[acyl-carrier protein] reductase